MEKTTYMFVICIYLFYTSFSIHLFDIDILKLGKSCKRKTDLYVCYNICIYLFYSSFSIHLFDIDILIDSIDFVTILFLNLLSGLTFLWHLFSQSSDRLKIEQLFYPTWNSLYSYCNSKPFMRGNYYMVEDLDILNMSLCSTK